MAEVAGTGRMHESGEIGENGGMQRRDGIAGLTGVDTAWVRDEVGVAGGASIRSRVGSAVAMGVGGGARTAAGCEECAQVPRWVLRLLRGARRDRLTGSLDLSLKDGVPSSVKRIIEHLEPSKIA